MLEENQYATRTELDHYPSTQNKVEMEKYILNKAKNGSNVTTVLRFATAFGISPRMRFDLTVNQFTLELLMGKELQVYDPDTWRPYCHVQDFSSLVETIVCSDKKIVNKQVFNAVSDKNYFTKRSFIKLIQKKNP